MLACLGHVLPPIVKRPNRLLERLLDKERTIIVLHRVFGFVEVERESQNNVERTLVVAVTT